MALSAGYPIIQWRLRRGLGPAIRLMAGNSLRLFGPSAVALFTRIRHAVDLAGVEDFEVAEAAYRAAMKKWPKAVITLRAGARVIHDSRQRGSSAARTSPALSAANS
jgi:hypothetical protein